MAKKEQMLRLKFIEQLLRRRKNKGASYEDIHDFLERKYREKDLEELKFTKRTFLRDKEAMLEVFGVEIVYRRASNTYVIESDEIDEMHEDVFDNLLLVEAYREAKDKKDIMFFEQRPPRGLHWMNGMVHAITHRRILTLDHTKFRDGITQTKTLEPYALKEFRNRWYLLANERDGQPFLLKTFCLDRISALEISATSFNKQSIDVQAAFVHSFGIIATPDETPEEVILSFDPEQGNYIKTLPLHHSQQIMVDDETELRIRLTLVPTYDFEREILSHGCRVRTISPESLRIRLKTEMQQMVQMHDHQSVTM